MDSRRVAIALVVGLLAGAAATYVLVGQGFARMTTTTTVTSVSTTTSTVTFDPTEQVRDAYLTYLQDVKSENASTVLGEYTNNATLGFETNNPMGGMGGGATGLAQIKEFYGELNSDHPTLNLANESYTVSLSNNESEATIHSNLTVYGESLYAPPNDPLGVYVENVALSIGFVHVGNDWLISNEYWYDVNGVDGCQSFSTPACSTLLISPNWSQYIGP